tara:strand:+ start:551 stop:736 length:186 start_codon:yes stop_codon:yes gene_type:complete
MNWLKEAIENYNNLSESEQAHVDAALDDCCEIIQDDEGLCLCGKKLSEGDIECYSHMTQGY